MRNVSLQAYHYPRSLLLFDGLRACFGMLVSLGPLIFLDINQILAVILSMMAGLFLWFGYRVLVQYRIAIVPTDDGFLYQGWQQHNWRWQDLKGLKLAYYAPMRRRGAGWYQLILKGKDKSIRLESTLIGFDDVLRSAATAAHHKELALDVATSENLHAWSLESGTGARGSGLVPHKPGPGSALAVGFTRQTVQQAIR